MDWTWAFQLAMAVASVIVDPASDDRQGGEVNSPTNSFDGRSSHRNPRLISFPPRAPMSVGLLVILPISVMIPTVSKAGRSDLARESGAKGTKREEEEEEEVGNDLHDDYVEDGDDETFEARSFSSSMPVYDNDLVHEEQLKKLDDYFTYMEVAGDKCKSRIICEVAAAPEDFYPVSDIVLRQIKPRGPVAPTKRSRFYRFLNAAKLGFNGDIHLCAKDLGCSYSGADVFDAKMLRVLQLLGRHLNIEFVDKD